MKVFAGCCLFSLCSSTCSHWIAGMVCVLDSSLRHTWKNAENVWPDNTWPKKTKQNKRRTGRRISSTLRGLPNAQGESEQDTKSERT